MIRKGSEKVVWIYCSLLYQLKKNLISDDFLMYAPAYRHLKHQQKLRINEYQERIHISM